MNCDGLHWNPIGCAPRRVRSITTSPPSRTRCRVREEVLLRAACGAAASCTVRARSSAPGGGEAVRRCIGLAGLAGGQGVPRGAGAPGDDVGSPAARGVQGVAPPAAVGRHRGRLQHHVPRHLLLRPQRGVCGGPPRVMARRGIRGQRCQFVGPRVVHAASTCLEVI